jgi:hypothetical protein
MAVDTEAAAADFAAVLAEVVGETPDAPEVAEEVADQGTDVSDTDEAAEETDSAAPEPEALTESELAAAKLIEAGDLDGALKRLGVDPKLVKVDRRQFFAMRQGLKKAAEKEQQGERAKGEAVKLRSEAEKLYGPIAAGFQAMRAGDGAKLRAAIELLAEDSWDNIAATVQRGNRPLDPATAEVMRLRAELAERDAKANQEQAKGRAAVAEKAQLAKLDQQLAKTPLAAVPGASRRIYDMVRASYDGVGYAVSVKQAYAAVKAEAEAVAKAFGAKTPPAPRGKPLPERRPVTPETRRLSQAEKDEAAFKRTIAEADQAAKANERRVRRGAR